MCVVTNKDALSYQLYETQESVIEVGNITFNLATEGLGKCMQ